MGQIFHWSQHHSILTKMSKLCLVFLAVLAVAATQMAFQEEEEANSRLVRSAGLVRKSKGPRKAVKSRSSKGARKAKSGKKKAVRSSKGARKAKSGKKKAVRKVGSATKSKSGRRKPVKKSGSGKKGTRTMKKKESGSRSTGRAVSDMCFANAMQAMKMWKDIFANFEKQRKRMEKQIGTADSKDSKSGVFESVYQKVLQTGGGDANALSCSGSTTNAGAAQLTNLTTVLSACQTDVAAVCNTTNWTGLANATLLTECDTLTATFKTEAEICLMKSVGPNATDTDDACACWDSEAMALAREDIKPCKFPTEAKAVADQLKVCVAKFGECRKYEDDAAISISACSSSVSALTEEANKLTANSDAVTQAQSAVSTLAGSRRVRRSDATGTALASCTEVSTVSITMLTLVIDFPTSPDIVTFAANIVASTSVVCTTDEQDALAALATSFEEAITHLAEAIEAIQEQLATLTGTTASAETIELGGGTATARAYLG